MDKTVKKITFLRCFYSKYHKQFLWHFYFSRDANRPLGVGGISIPWTNKISSRTSNCSSRRSQYREASETRRGFQPSSGDKKIKYYKNLGNTFEFLFQNQNQHLADPWYIHARIYIYTCKNIYTGRITFHWSSSSSFPTKLFVICVQCTQCTMYFTNSILCQFLDIL